MNCETTSSDPYENPTYQLLLLELTFLITFFALYRFIYLYVLTMAPGLWAKIYFNKLEVFITYLLSLGFPLEVSFSF